MTSVVDLWNIHPELGWLRGQRPESEVVFDERYNSWLIFGYQDTLDIISDPKTFSNKTAQLAAVQIDESFTEGDISQMDAPDHPRFRKAIAAAFTPRLVASLEARIAEVAAGLLDDLQAKDDIDLVRDFAYPLPVIVIADLLGIPNSDREMFMAHSSMAIEQMNGLSFLDSEQEADVGYAVEQFMPMVQYMRDQIAQRRQHPGGDLLSSLAQHEADGQRFTDNEIVNLANILLGAGHITTTMLLGN
ncbi:MAG: cytochrome P450, partial [Jatrophihabitantaceae bacterium]